MTTTFLRTFMLGVGCQKGGTSWLYNHLQGSPEFARGYRKEYHLFNSLDLPEEAWMGSRLLAQAEVALAAARRGEPADARSTHWALHWASMYVDPELYFDHFQSLLARDPRHRVTADVTPAYALLGADRFRAIRAGFAQRGIRTVPVFLMRDPVERTYSQVRMRYGRHPERYPHPPEVELAQQCGDRAYASRSDYAHTIAQLDASFDAADIGYGFYENLFADEQVRALTDLLGLEFRAPKVAKRRNESSTPPSPLPEDVVRTVAEHYRPVYEAVAARFPDLDLPTLWPHSRHVLA